MWLSGGGRTHLVMLWNLLEAPWTSLSQTAAASLASPHQMCQRPARTTWRWRIRQHSSWAACCSSNPPRRSCQGHWSGAEKRWKAMKIFWFMSYLFYTTVYILFFQMTKIKSPYQYSTLQQNFPLLWLRMNISPFYTKIQSIDSYLFFNIINLHNSESAIFLLQKYCTSNYLIITLQKRIMSANQLKTIWKWQKCIEILYLLLNSYCWGTVEGV